MYSMFSFYPTAKDAPAYTVPSLWLWICLSQASLHPSLVNVHVQHPPEAEVKIHQVARVQPGQRPAVTEGAHSVQQRSQPGNGHEHTSRHSRTHGLEIGQTTMLIHQNGHVGRCFQETVDGQVLCWVFWNTLFKLPSFGGLRVWKHTTGALSSHFLIFPITVSWNGKWAYEDELWIVQDLCALVTELILFSLKIECYKSRCIQRTKVKLEILHLWWSVWLKGGDFFWLCREEQWSEYIKSFLQPKLRPSTDCVCRAAISL